MSGQSLDAEASETVAGVVRLLRRAAELVWVAIDTDTAGFHRQLLALGIDLAADEARNLLPDAIPIDGPAPVGPSRPASYGLLSSSYSASPPEKRRPGPMAYWHAWRTSCGRRTAVSPTERRTVGELLADCDALARETLLDATFDRAPAMVRSWNQLVGSAAELWAALPSPQGRRSGSDPMERLRVVGAAIGRSVRARHWPGHGPTDEHLREMGDNLFRARHLVERRSRPLQSKTAETQAQLQQFQRQLMHTLYVAAHGTAVALGAYVTDLQDRLQTGTRRRQPLAERPTALEITSARGMIARFDGFERLAAAYLFGMPPTSANPDQTSVAAPATRLETALAVWEVQAHRTLANGPDAADLVRVARVQALITSTTSVVIEAAARSGHIDGEVIRRLAPALDASQVAWNRTAKRWAELTNPASRTDPSLVSAASEVRAAIAAIATNQTGWATPDQLSGHNDLPKSVKTLHLSMIASLDIAYVVRDTAVDHPGLIAPARIIGMRAQGEAELAIEQGETRYEGVTWTTPSQLAANQLIPLPEPARRGLINLADEVIASTNRAVAATAQVDTSKLTRSMRSDHATYRGRSFESLQITRAQGQAPKGPSR